MTMIKTWRSWKHFAVLAELHFKAEISSVCKQEQKWKHTIYITTGVLLEWVTEKSKRGHTSSTENSLYLEWQNSTTSHHRMEQSASQITWFLFQEHPVKPNPHKGLVCQGRHVPPCRLPVSWTTWTLSHLFSHKSGFLWIVLCKKPHCNPRCHKHSANSQSEVCERLNPLHELNDTQSNMQII